MLVGARILCFLVALVSSFTLFFVSFGVFDDPNSSVGDDCVPNLKIVAYKCMLCFILWFHTLFLVYLSFFSGYPKETYRMGADNRAGIELFVLFTMYLFPHFVPIANAIFALTSIIAYVGAVAQLVREAEDVKAQHVFLVFMLGSAPPYAVYLKENGAWVFILLGLLLIIVSNYDTSVPPHNMAHTRGHLETCLIDEAEAEEISSEESSNPRVCSCQEVPKMWISWSDRNPCRRFICCSNHQSEKNCEFFEWIDPTITGWQKKKVAQMRKQVVEEMKTFKSLSDTIRLLREENEELKSKVEKELEEEKSA